MRVLDDDGNVIGPYQVFVNVELLVVHREDQVRSGQEQKEITLPCVIHDVYESDGNVNFIGMFLRNNSITFASKLRNNTLVQDMVSFAICARDSEQNVDDKFVKNSLKYFSKGSTRNIKTILDFVKLPMEYVTKFMKMVHGFETCSLQGQPPVSVRHLRQKGTRLELPLSFLKAHLSVETSTRESLLRDILGRKIGFQTYKVRIMKSSNAGQNSMVKISTPSKKNVPSVLPEDVSLSIINAPNTPSELSPWKKRPAAAEDDSLEHSPSKRPKMLNKQFMSFTSQQFAKKEDVVVIAELQGKSLDFDVGDQVVRALGAYYREEDASNNVVGIFFR